MTGNALRGLEVLAFLSEQSAPITAQRIALATGMSRATTYRVLGDLADAGWLSSTDQPSRLELSLKVAQLGIAALRRDRLRDVLVPNAVEMARLTGRVVLLAFYERGDVIFTDATEVVGDRVMPMLLGRRAPAACTASGKILLALRDPGEAARVVARGLPKLARNTKTEPAEIERDIQLTRERGYGLAYEEFEPGSGGLSVPVFDHSGTAVAACGVTTKAPPSEAFIEEFLPLANKLAARASAELGYRSGAHIPIS